MTPADINGRAVERVADGALHLRPRIRRIAGRGVSALGMMRPIVRALGTARFGLAIASAPIAASAAVVVPRNLSAGGPPGDPLPAVRENHPSAAEMVRRPLQHPYLFFDAASIKTLREDARTGPLAELTKRVVASAEKDLATPLPPLAAVYEGIPRLLPDGSFNPAEEAHHYDDFYRQAYIVKRVIPELGLAYQVTGEARFGDAGKAWLLNFAERPKLARKDRAADFDAANMAFGLALGYDWLCERLTGAERARVLAAIVKLAGPMAARGRELLDERDPQRNRSSYGNNHQSRTFGLFGVVALSVLYEVPEARAWLDQDLQLMRDRIFPSAFAPDGEYLDEWDHFDSSLNDPLPFVVALRRMGGEDLFHDPSLEPRFRGISRYYLYGLEERTKGPSDDYGWLALAGGLKDGTDQWIVARDGGLRRVDPVLGWVCYDPTVECQPPADPAGSVYFPYSGMVKLCSNWSPRGILMPFHCGAEVGKELGDQNGFYLRAGGEWLLPRLPTDWGLTTPPIQYHWALAGWFRAAAQNVIVADPEQVSDFADYRRTGTVVVRGGTERAAWAVPVKLSGDQWLSGPNIPKSGDLRAVQFDPAVDYVCGEAHRAYDRFRPKLWLRHILFVKAAGGAPAYFLVCDEVRAGAGGPATFAWQLMSGGPFALTDRGLRIAAGGAALDVRLLAPDADRPIRKETPAPVANRTPFFQWTTPGPEPKCFFLAALVPHTSMSRGEAPISFRALPAVGGWAVEATSAAGTDVTLFRADRAASVSVGPLTTRSPAALFRRFADGRESTYRLGAP